MRTDPTPRRRRLALVLPTLALLAAGALLALWLAIDAIGTIPVSVTIDGQEMLRDLDLAALHPGHKFALAAALLVLGLTLLVAVPLALLLSAGAALVVVLLPLAATLLALAIALSPLALLGWLLWRATRRSPSIGA
ncbi:MAG: hypothetical protein HYZ20_16960 [Burkholderiales bacterium]|nr:hypothetical protein [Burkholderiales bacterium]